MAVPFRYSLLADPGLKSFEFWLINEAMLISKLLFGLIILYLDVRVIKSVVLIWIPY